jgi:hypothetical protein
MGHVVALGGRRVRVCSVDLVARDQAGQVHGAASIETGRAAGPTFVSKRHRAEQLIRRQPSHPWRTPRRDSPMSPSSLGT